MSAKMRFDFMGTSNPQIVGRSRLVRKPSHPFGASGRSPQRDISRVVEQRIEISWRMAEHPREQRHLTTMVNRVNRRMLQHLSHGHAIRLPRHEAELNDSRQVRLAERRQKITLVPLDFVGKCNYRL